MTEYIKGDTYVLTKTGSEGDQRPDCEFWVRKMRSRWKRWLVIEECPFAMCEEKDKIFG